jgi:hypothetical protein
MKKTTFALLFAAAMLAVIATAADPDTVTRERQRVLRDPSTNATVTTAYTAQAAGQLLTGRLGIGTNAVWMATAAGTNQWILVAKEK